MDSNDKKRARLNLIRHLLDSIPYTSAPRQPISLPKRLKAGAYRQPDYPFKFIAEPF